MACSSLLLFLYFRADAGLPGAAEDPQPDGLRVGQTGRLKRLEDRLRTAIPAGQGIGRAPESCLWHQCGVVKGVDHHPIAN